MPFVNQDILIGGVVGICSMAQNIPLRFAGEGCCVDLHDQSLCYEVTTRGRSCTCVLLFLSTDFAVCVTEISAFGNISRFVCFFFRAKKKDLTLQQTIIGTISSVLKLLLPF